MKKTKEEKQHTAKKITVIDLFSGAGGFSLSALRCGLDVTAAIEIDKDACETYKKNIVEKRSNSTKLFSDDILTIEPKRFRDELGMLQGQLDLLIGGPPCQGFSSHRLNGQGIDDPRNKLLLRYFDFVKELKPKLFLVENVPGLLWERHESHLKTFKECSAKNGYKLIGPLKLNAKNYGVPQNRDRVFILGVRDDIDVSSLQWPPKPTHFPSEMGLPEWKSASVVFETPPTHVMSELKRILGKDKGGSLEFGAALKDLSKDPCAIHMDHTKSLKERFKATPINGSREDIDFRLPCHAGKYGGHKDVYGRIRLAQPGPTITTGCFNPSKGRFLHPWLNHGITARHAARFQTFPDDYVFTGGITSQGKQIGNAVPVKLGESLLKAIKKFLTNLPE